jgi:hypothetical protein
LQIAIHDKYDTDQQQDGSLVLRREMALQEFRGGGMEKKLNVFDIAGSPVAGTDADLPEAKV